MPEKVAVYVMELWSLIEKPNNSPTYLKDFSHFRYTENLLHINRYLLIKTLYFNEHRRGLYYNGDVTIIVTIVHNTELRDTMRHIYGGGGS